MTDKWPLWVVVVWQRNRTTYDEPLPTTIARTESHCRERFREYLENERLCGRPDKKAPSRAKAYIVRQCRIEVKP